MEPAEKIINTFIGAAILIILGILAISITLDIQDARSPHKKATCTVKEKTLIGGRGGISDREVRTEQCGKFSAGKRLKIWDALEEDDTYIFTYKGGHSGLRDLIGVHETTAKETP